jgi:SAM-dependent methyltransferase
MNPNWEGYKLEGGQRLERDPRYGFYRVMPRPTDGELESFYRTAYKNPCVPHDPGGRVDLLCKQVPRAGRVLDIGCGNGEFLAELKRRGWDVLGVEPGLEYAERARSLGIEVIEDLITSDNVESFGKFDAVLLLHVLEHLPRPEEMLNLVRQLLRPGGVFFCEVPNDFNPLQEVVVATQDQGPWWIAVPDHLNYFSIESLAAFLNGNGFVVETATTDFPMELFLLLGENYVGDLELGRAVHLRRCALEKAMREAGKGVLLTRLYFALAELGIGREAIVIARLG